MMTKHLPLPLTASKRSSFLLAKATHFCLFCLVLQMSFLSASAQSGKALDFDGSDDFITLPIGLNGGSYTKEAWINTGKLTDFPNILSGSGTAIFLNSGQLAAGHAPLFDQVIHPVTLSINTWYHVAVTYNATTQDMHLYLDGVLVESATGVTGYSEPTLSISNFIGGNYFLGQIDEVRLWGTDRSAADILATKDCELGGDEPFLLAYYNFNEGIAGGTNTGITSLTDSQDKCIAANGTLFNFALTGATSNFVDPGPALTGSCGNTFPNISVAGNSNCITSGDITPSSTDHTNFGTYIATTINRTFTISNTGLATLNLSGPIVISGPDGADFTVTTAPAVSVLAAGASTTFVVSFTPTGGLGIKSATVTVNNDDADEATFNFAVQANYGTPPGPGKALDFDGVNDYVDIPVAISGSYTKEMWINTNTLADFPNILSGTGTAVFLNAGRVAGGHAPGFNQVLSGTTLTLNTWHHVAISYNAATQEMKLYLDGALDQTATSVATATDPSLTLGQFFGGNYFWGRMDDVRIWNTERSAAEILANKDCELTGDEPGLIAYYNCNQGTSGDDNTTITTLTDTQDKCAAANGTLHGFALDGAISNFVEPGAALTGGCANSFPNINITGNSVCILTGDITPSLTDDTRFGAYSGTPITKTFTIENTGTADLTISGVTITGANAADFTVTTLPAATVTPGGTTTFVVSFEPLGTAGTKIATVTINNNDGDEGAYNFVVDGSNPTGPPSPGTALDFDGTDDYATLPVFNTSGSYTKEAWINPNNVFGFPNIISGDGTAIYLNNLQLSAGNAPGFNQVTDPIALTPGTWYHIAVTYDSATGVMNLYKNGTLVNTASGVPAYTESYLELGTFFLSNYFSGRIDEVRLWKVARSAAEIAASRDCELTGDEPGLIAYYNFNQGDAEGDNTAITALTDTQDKCTPGNATLHNFALTGTTSNFIAAGPVLTGTCTATFANINVTGNGLCVALGDITPSLADHTSFGDYAGTTLTRTFTIENTGTATLTITSASITGVDAADFTIAVPPTSTVAPGSSTTFTVEFNPTGATGIKTATVTINNDDGDETVYNFNIDGNNTIAGNTPVVTVVDNCDGTSTLSTTAPGDLLWSTGETTPSITVNTAGIYTVTSTVSGNTSAPGSGTAAPKTTPATPVVTVVDNCDGTSVLSTTAAGTLLWSTAETTASITVTTAATYSVTTTDNGCTSLPGSGAAVPKTAPAVPDLTIVDNCDGTSILFTSAGGTLLWNTGETTATITVTTAGTYSVTQTVDGCISLPASGTATPGTAPGAPVVTVVDNCNGTSTLSTTATGDLLWSTGETTASIIVSIADVYTVTTTVNGCVSDNGSGTANPGTTPAAPTATVTHQPDCALLSGTITVTTVPGFTYSIGGVYQTSGTFSGLTPGNYTVTAQSAGNCVSAGTDLTIDPLPDPSTCNSIVNLKVYLQGYYVSTGVMNSVLQNQGVAGHTATETDSITVELHDPVTFALFATATGIVNTNGTIALSYPNINGASYYIVVKHRNSLETWSAAPVLFGATTTYDFTDAATKAFGNNLTEVEPGVWAIYTGDLNQDGFIDAFDFPLYDIDNENGVNMIYKATDMNGDGFVDAFDYPVFDSNNQAGRFSIHP